MHKENAPQMEDTRTLVNHTEVLIANVQGLLERHGCDRVKDLPDSETHVLLQQLKGYPGITEHDRRAIEDYWAGGEQPDAKLVSVLLGSEYGRVQ